MSRSTQPMIYYKGNFSVDCRTTPAASDCGIYLGVYLCFLLFPHQNTGIILSD